MLEVFLLLFQMIQAKGDKAPVQPGVIVGPRAVAPLTVVERPVIAQFRFTRTKQAEDGSTIIESALSGRFLRDKRGFTRTEFFDPDLGEKNQRSVGIVFLWNPETHTMTLLSFLDQTAMRVERPNFPQEDRWLFGAMEGPVLGAKHTDEEKTIHGFRCQRVLFEPVENRGANSRDEAWVAFDWGLVLLDVAKEPGREVRWEIVQAQKAEPPASLFEVPAGFAEK